MIPAPVVKLNEANTRLHQSSRQQTIVWKRRVITLVEHSWIIRTFRRRNISWLSTVHLQNVLWLLRDVHDFRHRCLHPIRQLILRNASLRFRVSRSFELRRIHLGQSIQHASAEFAIHPCRITQVQNGITGRATLNSLINRRQKPGTPQRLSCIRRLST